MAEAVQRADGGRARADRFRSSAPWRRSGRRDAAPPASRSRTAPSARCPLRRSGARGRPRSRRTPRRARSACRRRPPRRPRRAPRSRRRARRCLPPRARGTRARAPHACARAVRAPARSRERGRPPRRLARSPRRRRPPARPAPPRPTRIGGSRPRSSGAAGRPQNVTTTSAACAAVKCAARAKGRRTFTATGAEVRARTAAISRDSTAGGWIPIVPRPPASLTAAASALPAIPPPMPAWTTGRATPRRSSSDGTRGTYPQPSRHLGVPSGCHNAVPAAGGRPGAPKHRRMSEPIAQRTLVKSPPELWAEISDVEALARHLGAFGEIRITRVVPETTVSWEGETARGTVELSAAGWGTKVTLRATPTGPPRRAPPRPSASIQPGGPPTAIRPR